MKVGMLLLLLFVSTHSTVLQDLLHRTKNSTFGSFNRNDEIDRQATGYAESSMFFDRADHFNNTLDAVDYLLENKFGRKTEPAAYPKELVKLLKEQCNSEQLSHFDLSKESLKQLERCVIDVSNEYYSKEETKSVKSFISEEKADTLWMDYLGAVEKCEEASENEENTIRRDFLLKNCMAKEITKLLARNSFYVGRCILKCLGNFLSRECLNDC